jgi:hypothetical protein
MNERTYRPRHYLKMSGQPHAPAALYPLYPLDRILSEPRRGGGEKSFPYRDSNSDLSAIQLPAPSSQPIAIIIVSTIQQI